MNFNQEKTFVMIKPDAVCSGLIGDIIKRFEQRRLKIVALEMQFPTREMMDNHYPKDPAWITRLGTKLLTGFSSHNMDPVAYYGTDDAEKLGPIVRNWLLDYFTMGPIVKMVVQGPHAVEMARKIIGATMPFSADIGTIRGDFSADSAVSANMANRTVFNLVHASETQDEAVHEISYWFGDDKVFSYERFGVS